MARLRLILLVVLLGTAGWFIQHSRQQDVPITNLDLDFEYDPAERFNMDKTKSWIATGIVILVASGLLAL